MTASQSAGLGLKVLAGMALVLLVPMVLLFGLGMAVAVVQKILQLVSTGTG